MASPGGDEQARLVHNREVWSVVSGDHTDAEAELRWARGEVTWGLFGIPEAGLQLLGDVAGLDVVELGCGTAALSGGLSRVGARTVGIDLSPEQLATARRCQRLHGVTFPLVEATADRVPLRSGCADLVVSDYGVAPWCDPLRWVPEAARLLRPGGRLVFLTNSVLAGLCVPAEGGVAGTTLLRPQHDLRRIAWPGGGIEHHPGHGEWVAHLRRAGLLVERLQELRAPDGASAPDYYDIVSPEWAAAWPAEDVWVASKAD